MDNSHIKDSEKDRLGKAAGIVSFYTLLSRILGLVRDMVIARFFGAGMAADALFVALKIPNMLRRFTAEGSMTIAFIPVFTEYMEKKSREDAFELARVTLTLLSIILVLVTFTGVILSPWIVRMIAWGYGTGEKYELTVLLTRITFPYLFFVSIVAFFMGVLNSLRHFAAPAAAPIFLNLGIIGCTLFLSPYMSEPVIGAAIGVIIGGVAQVALQMPWVIKKGLSLAPRWMPDHPAVKRIGMLILPSILGSAVYQINQLVGTLLASLLREGSVSWLYYADRLMELPLGVFAIAISTATLPSLARQAAGRNMADFKDTLNHSLKLTFFITIPSMAGLIVLGKPIIHLFFQRGAFDAFSTDMTAKALIFYAVGLWAFSGVKIIVSGFYALQDTVTPVRVSIFTLISYTVFGLLLKIPLEHCGLALALSLSSSLQFVILIFLLSGKIDGWNLFPVIKSMFKSLCAAITMGLAVVYIHSAWLTPTPESTDFYLSIKLIILVCTGIVVYFGTARIMGCEEISFVYNILSKRAKRE
jgi:putative peptidoglycan lipid II flippase